MTEMLVEPMIETRSGDGYEVADVNFPKRIVTCIVMPYEQPATIHEPARSYQEIVSRSAFDGVERRPTKVKANRDHIWDKLVGKVVALHPSRREGLIADVKIFGTEIGERTLVECDEGGLDVSAGFGLLRRDNGQGPVWPDAETWERNGAVRRLNRLFLDHVAFVPNPAHPGATVVSVRNTPGTPQQPPTGDATPNRDSITLQKLMAEKAALDARWSTR